MGSGLSVCWEWKHFRYNLPPSWQGQGEALGLTGMTEAWNQKQTLKAFKLDGGVGTENPAVTPDFPLSTTGLATSVEMSLESFSLFLDPQRLELKPLLAWAKPLLGPACPPSVGGGVSLS